MIQRLVFLLGVMWPLVGIASLPDRIFHVRDFGAVADGTTDSGDAIRAAIAAAVAGFGPAGSTSANGHSNSTRCCPAAMTTICGSGRFRLRSHRRRGQRCEGAINAICFPS